MQLIINHEKKFFTTLPASVEELLHLLSHPLDGIAVAINHTVIPKTDWKTAAIHDHDTILIITASQGG